MRKGKLLLTALLLGLTATPAHAVTIKNLGDRPYTLTVEQLGRKQEITLAPGQRYIRNGTGITLHREGRSPILTHPMAEYSIWPDGDIYIQRYDKVQIGSD